jgi:predicted CXXCH cytochrome family protein
MARMRKNYFVLGLTVSSIFFFSQNIFAGDQCISCHTDVVGDKPSELFKHDIHFKKGLSCADCHGGNSKKEEMEDAMNPKEGYKGVPKGDEISQTCARCHADSTRMQKYGSTLPTNQWANLQASVHGMLSLSGKEHIAQCTTCHNAHGIVPVKDKASPVYPLNIINTCSKCHANATYMRNYNPSLPIDQVEKYRTSVHGILNEKGDPKSAVCSSCHGSHDIRNPKDAKSSVYAVNLPGTCSKCHSDAQYMKQYKIPTDQYEKYAKSVHGVALLQKHDVGAPSCNSCHGNHGATPPGVESISKVCGTCHALNADLFSSSPHKKAFDERKLPECETCHSNHDIVSPTDQFIGVTANAVCSRCHQQNENPKGYAVAKTMRQLADSLNKAGIVADSLVHEAEQKGMEVTDAKFKLRDARQAHLEMRTMVHAFNEGKFREVINKGMTATVFATNEAEGAINEYYFRRIGLGVSTLIITILSIALFVYIRRVEKKQIEKKE